MACVDLPDFSLQLLLRRHPDWARHPAVVVDKDKPQGVILQANARARRCGILPGMRYAKGRTLAPALMAGLVPPEEIARRTAALTARLRFFTPHVEAAAGHPATDRIAPGLFAPGLFWLDASGLSLLHPSLQKWAGLIGAELARAGYRGTVSVGFTRYGTYATTRTGGALRVFATPAEERAHARAVPIARLNFPPDLRDALIPLGITTLGDFVDLPAGSIRKRFGMRAHALYTLAKDECFAPVDTRPPVAPPSAHTDLDDPIADTARLTAVIDELLQPVLDTLAERDQCLTAIALTLTLERSGKRVEVLRPAAPTRERGKILPLITLRLQRLPLEAGVVAVTLEAEGGAASHKQLELFRKTQSRNARSIEEAFARLRAEFGDRAVVRARLREAHLPEACYEWEAMDTLSPPAPRRVRKRRLVRRIFARSVALLAWVRHRGAGPANGVRVAAAFSPARPVPNPDVIGPYIVSGGWWRRKIHREYYYVRARGGWLWVYYDHRRKRAFVQGQVG